MTSDQQGRTKRNTRVWLALAAVLVLIALLVLPPLISIARYKSSITRLVSQALHRPVRLSSVELRALPRPGFVLTDLTVSEDPAYGTEPVLHANTVTTAIRFSSLWRGELQISRISVDEASLNLVHTPDGRWNIDALFQTAASMARPGSGRSIPYPYLEATNSRINVKDGFQKLPYSLLNADASLWQDSGVWRVRLRAQPARTDVVLDPADTGVLRLEATLHPGPQFDQMPLHVDLDWREAQLGQLSRLMLGSDAGWRGNLTGEAHVDGTLGIAKVTSRLRATGVHRAEFAPTAPLDFDANCAFSFNSSTRDLHDLLCNSPIGNGRARITGDLPGSANPDPARPLHLTVELDRIPAQLGLDILRTLRTNVAPGLQAEGTVSGKMSFQPPPTAGPAPAASPRGRRSAPAAQPANPLTGSFTLDSLRLTGNTLTTPIQVPKITVEAALAASSQPPALTTAFQVPAGGPSPLNCIARFGLRSFQIGVRGAAALPRLRELLHVAGIPQAASLDQLAGEPAQLDLTAEGPWLASGYPQLPKGPGAPVPLLPAEAEGASGSLSGTLSLRDANWKPDFLANAALIHNATLHFENGALRWDPISFTYGPVQGTATLTLPASCASEPPCTPSFTAHFDALDAAALQSALLGARESGTVLSTLLDRLKPNSSPDWPSIEGTISASNLILDPFTFRNLSASVRLQPAQAEIAALDADFLGGKLRATASLTPGAKPAYKLDGSFQQLDPAQLGELVGMKWSGGPIAGDGHLELAGYTTADLTSSATGKLHLDWPHGSMVSIVGTPVPAALARFDRFTADIAIADSSFTLGKNEVQHGARKSSVAATAEFGTPASVSFAPSASAQPVAAHR